jgi:hypothetical protein
MLRFTIHILQSFQQNPLNFGELYTMLSKSIYKEVVDRFGGFSNPRQKSTFQVYHAEWVIFG